MANTETFGLKLYMGDGASPEVFTKIAGVTEIGGLFSFERSTIDTSELEDTVKSFLAGQLDPGNVEFTVKFDPNEGTHDDSTGLIDAMLTRGTKNFSLEIPASDAAGAATSYMHFAGVVVGLNPAGAQDDIIRATCTIKMSGQPTFDENAPNTS